MQQHRTWVELSTEALWHNIATVQALCHSAQLGVVIKANAYGHGMIEIAQLLEQHPAVQWLFVAGTSEGIALRQAGIHKKILALSYQDSSIFEAIAHNIAMVVYSIEDVQSIHEAARAQGKQARIHIKVDTRMSRLGILAEEVDLFLTTILRMPGVYIEGIFTHLSDTNNVDLSFTYQQVAVFDAALANSQYSTEIPYKHVLASGALMLEQKYDLVRAGTNIYGLWKSEIQKKRFEALVPNITLKPVLTWKAKIVQIKKINAGAAVGYNRSYIAQKPMVIAMLGVGYYDGYPRHLSNKGSVWVRGMLAPVIGMVSMNITTIDVTHIPEVSLLDEVILIGKQLGVTATEIATMVETINNELISCIHECIPRIVLEDRLQTAAERYEIRTPSVASPL